jgi:hypothetical protein
MGIAQRRTPARRRRRTVACSRSLSHVCRRALAGTRNIRLREFHGWSEAVDVVRAGDETVVILLASEIPADPTARLRAKQCRRLVFQDEGLPVEGLPPRLRNVWGGPLHVAHETGRARESLIARAVTGFVRSAPERILDAWVEDGRLRLVSTAFEWLTVPFERLVQYVPRKQDRFEIDEDGSFLYWPDFDVHMGWTQLLQLVKPEAGLAAKQRSADFNARYGEAIRAFREQSRLRQRDIAGLDPRQVRRIEQGARATPSALRKLAKAHGMDLADYLGEVAKRA